MHEHDFQILEGRDITLPELGKEIENITGRTVTHSTGDIKRVVAHLPNFESESDTFVATFKLNHRNDYIDATFVAPKNQRNKLKEIPVHIELISYISKINNLLIKMNETKCVMVIYSMSHFFIIVFG